MTDPRTDWDRLGRYLSGESSPAERADVEQWLAQNPSEARALTALDQATRGMAPSATVDVEAALRRVKSRRAAVTPSRVWRYAAMAAAAAVVIATRDRPALRPADRAPAQTYAAAPGRPDSVNLSERVQAVLAPGSRASISGDTVQLTGRGFFVVAHDEARSLTVRAGNVTVRDVGTRFAVEQNPDGSVRVVVTEGAVDVTSGSGPGTRVSAGDIAVAAASRVQLNRGGATADDVAWTRGKLVFRDAALSAVFEDLHRWYGVEILVRDSALLNRHFSGEFENQSAERVLQTLALALGTRLQRSADTVILGNLSPAR